MECLHCGDCCLRMSPISNPCPYIVLKDNYMFCANYENRPQQCRDHRFDSSICPIGINTLKIRSPQEIADRIDGGWKLIEAMKQRGEL